MPIMPTTYSSQDFNNCRAHSYFSQISLKSSYIHHKLHFCNIVPSSSLVTIFYTPSSMGIIFSVSISLDNLFSCCFDRILKQPNYAFELGECLALLRNDWDELKRRRNDIKRRIEVEESYEQNKRLDLVDGWLLRIDAMEAEVDELIREGSRESVNKCLGSCCPKNCKTSYKLGKKLAKKQGVVTDLLKKGIFDVVTSRVSFPPADERPVEPTLGLESTLDEVWSYIEDEQVGMIGLYGMGGIGKTTLLTQVNNKLSNLTTQGFDIVVWTVVSKTPTLTKVQNDIGEKIGFHGEVWKYKSQENKAIDILRVLKEKKYLLLLDDIWDRFDLVNLGFPPPNPTNKSKVVFTTRSKGVCSLMKAHKTIKVKCLTDEVAWNLFQREVGEEALQAHSEIPELAKVVAKECGGLPLALITTGRAMASKMIPQAWHHAIELLKRYTSEFTGMEEKVFSLLKFSYDTLPNAAIRSCFLYCSLYPEDDEILKKELIDYWICEGFLVRLNDLSKARNEGYDYINTLVHASLLEECSLEKVKMHDMIRDMALWIACDHGANKDNFFVQARAGLSEIPNVAEWEGAERVSLLCNEITNITGTPNCPNLLTLFLNHNFNCKRITSGFFQYMPNLRVLNLSGNRGCTSSILKEICELVSLQYLELSGTSIQELPTEFQNLINLKYLSLNNTGICKIQEGVLSSFKKLQMLKVVGLKLGWPWGGIPVKELKGLEYLNDLEITLESDFDLSDFLSFKKFIIITTTLELAHCPGTRYIDMLVLKEMRHLESLYICNCESLEEFKMGNGKAGFLNIINHNYFPQLHNLRIVFCTVLKDITWLAFAPNLEDIFIFFCSGMKEVVGEWKWDGEDVEDGDHQQINMEIIPFAKLRRLVLSNISQLESIYPTPLAFPCLKDLQVYGCPKLKKLPLNSSSSSGCKSEGNNITITITITIMGEEEWWNGLEWEDEATRLAFLPSFKPVSLLMTQ